MNAGSAFGISIRSEARARAPRAFSAASWSRSQRISRWSATNPTGQTRTSVDPALVQLLEVVEDVRPEPAARRSATRSGTRTTSRRAPARSAIEPRRLEQLVLVRIARFEDPRGQRVGGEDDVCVGSADAVRQQLDEAGLVVPAVDEGELGAAVESALELAAVAGDRHRRVVRREHEPDDRLGAGGRPPRPRPRRCAASSASCPVKTGTSPSSASSAARVSSVIAFSGEPSSMPSLR